MSTVINIDLLGPQVAVLRPTIVGAAFRIFLLGGSALSEKQRKLASGSAYLMNGNGDEVMALVTELERRIMPGASVNG